MRTVQTRFNEDGSATTHLVVRCTLEGIAKATGIKLEDVSFALAEMGLLRHRQGTASDKNSEVTFSRQMLEQASLRWKPRLSLILSVHLKFS